MKSLNLFNLKWAAMLACLLAFTACGEGKEPEPDDTTAVTGVKLNKATLSLAEKKTETLKATVLPAEATNKAVEWSVDKTDIASVDENGLVTAIAEGTATITVKTKDGDFEAACALSVAPAPVGHPVFGEISFRTATTKKVGQQTWSDVVMASGCKKDDFDGGYLGADSNELYADCRQAPGYGDLFSWEAIGQYQDDLCPGDWRVPTKEDFIALDLTLGGTGEDYQDNPALGAKYITVWGAELGGMALNNQYQHVGVTGNYWSQSTHVTEKDGDLRGYALVVSYGEIVHVCPSFYKVNGFNIRCVK